MLAAPYAERYLGLLSEREGQRHYFEADLTTCTKNLHAKKVFLLHGTLEEKYHVTHSMLIAKSLIEKRFSFQQQVIFSNELPLILHYEFLIFPHSCIRMPTTR